MATYFISDIHCSAAEKHLTDLLMHFLKSIAVNADALYILGDLFEVWLGDDDCSNFNNLIIQALHNYSKTTPVYILHGNRDFLLGKAFCNKTGCRLLDEMTVIELYGSSTLLMHGDLLCIDDKQYLAFREKVRSSAFIDKMLAKPLWFRKLMAAFYRFKSKKHTQKQPAVIMDANENEIKRWMKELQVKQLIHGHTHRPSIHIFYQEQQIKQRIVLSDWHLQGNYLIVQPDGMKRLEYFSLK